jgi:cyclic dehypoxanthinyl futalosine synthase
VARRHAPRAPRRPAHDGDDDVRHGGDRRGTLEHLLRLRALQDETGGFTAFITWSYQPITPSSPVGGHRLDYLRTLAIARIVLDNFDNLQASWVTQGGKVGQLSLAYGANDMAAS